MHVKSTADPKKRLGNSVAPHINKSIRKAVTDVLFKSVSLTKFD
jgi:hypothetical protein